ncbi:MAG: IS701 family transposase, partial [Rhodanobacteraceae bacterium]
SNLPKTTRWRSLVDTVMGGWRIERDHRELKQELGFGQYEGRNWRGFHHHASLCIAAYGFLLLERLASGKRSAAGWSAPVMPDGFRPRGAGADAAPRA